MARYVLAWATLGLGLVLLGLWAVWGQAAQIEAQIRANAARALAGAGVTRDDDLRWQVSGRDIVVSGLASNPGGSAAVIAALNAVPGRRVLRADVQDLPLADPFVLVAHKETALRLSGVVPSPALRAQWAARFGPTALADVTLAAGAPQGWEAMAQTALSALALLQRGKITIEGQTVIVTGAVLTRPDLDRLKAALAGVPLRVMDVQVLDDGLPIAFQLRYSTNGGAQVQGKLPPGTTLDAMAKLLRLPQLSGAPSLAQVGAAQDMAYLATWAAVLPQVQDLVAEIAPGARFLRAKLQPGADAAAVQAALATGGFTVTLTAPPPNPKPALVVLPPPRLPQPPAPQPQQVQAPTLPLTLALALPRLPAPDFTALVPRKSAMGFDLTASGCQGASDAMLAQRSLLFLPYLDTLDASALPLLADLTALARDCLGAGLVVEIGGHTDTSGKADENLSLSARRADAIRNSLLAAGLPAEQMIAKGYGAAQPITENETKEGRAKNRRIALIWADHAPKGN